jgi:hypothetical protein
MAAHGYCHASPPQPVVVSNVYQSWKRPAHLYILITRHGVEWKYPYDGGDQQASRGLSAPPQGY